MYRCEESNSTCVCGDNYLPVHNISYDDTIYYEYYNIRAVEETICLPCKYKKCKYVFFVSNEIVNMEIGVHYVQNVPLQIITTIHQRLRTN